MSAVPALKVALGILHLVDAVVDSVALDIGEAETRAQELPLGPGRDSCKHRGVSFFEPYVDSTRKLPENLAR